MLLVNFPLYGNRINGRLLPKHNFQDALNKVLNPKRCSCGLEAGDYTCLTPSQIRRLKFWQECQNDGIPTDGIDTHSFRKGAANYASAGTTAAPSIVAICHRAGWKISSVLHRYLSMESAGDQFCGRVCAGLPIMRREFCVLPPQFGANLTAEEAELIATTLELVFPNMERWGHHFRAVCAHLFATVCYHYEFLHNLPATHPWHTSPLGRNPAKHQRLQRLIELKCHGDDASCRCTGIPPLFEAMLAEVVVPIF